MSRKKNILIIVSNYYQDISDNLIEETKKVIEENNILYQIETVTGVFEIPSIVSFSKHKFDGYIALGCVIRGETSHYDYVCSESARALMNLSLDGFAIGYGILTVENYEQAMIRSKTVANKSLGKGKVAALACINQINLKIKYTNGT
jgi:6,7-dimethyl-8-ribityllumazine synthase